MTFDEEPEAEEGSPAWMTSFADMLILMLCFFVLLSSFAKTDQATFASAAGSLRTALGSKPNEAVPPRASAPREARASEPPPNDAGLMARPDAVQRVRELLAARGLGSSVEVSRSERGVVLRARDHILFGSAEATLGVAGHPVLDAVSELMRSFSGQLAVEGHSDDRPIESSIFPSNWELSGARAAAVLRYLLRAGIDRERLHVAGYADTKPIASNTTEEGRAHNRRVEFVFEHTSPHEPPRDRGRGADVSVD